MKHKCDWPHCEAQSEQPFTDGWGSCGGENIPFLPDDCMLCPKHAEMYEETACNPWLLTEDEDGDEDEAA
jgi:hypothetical protein